MKAFVVILAFVSLQGTCADHLGYAAEARWSYDDQDLWPGTCTTGTLQSPINIDTSKALVDGLGVHIRSPLSFNGYEKVEVIPENNAKTLEWQISPNWTAPVLSGGPLRSKYVFAQFHLHWLSEHAIDGHKYPMEIHFVHIKQGLTLDQALLEKDGLAVVATFCDVSSDESAKYPLEEIMDEIVVRRGEVGEPIKISMKRLLSPDPQLYYTYLGSLTTPGCSETVTWIVMEQPLIINDRQLKKIHSVDVKDKDNFRVIQPTNRVVYRSRASSLSPSLLAIITVALSKISSSVKKGICALINQKSYFVGDDTSASNCLKIDVQVK